jgi:hypothetical protein
MPHDLDLPPLAPLMHAADPLRLDPASCALLVVDLQYFDALDLGYRVLVVEDACAASSGTDHRLALQRLRGPACRIVTTDEVVAALAVAPPRDRREISGIERVRPYLPKPPAARSADVDPYDLIFPPPQRVEVARVETAVLVLDANLLASDPQGPLLRRAREVDPNHSQDAYLARVPRREGPS